MADYVPQNPTELQYYNSLFHVANTEGTTELGGMAAVKFFNLSGVDVGFLKKIWGMSTDGSTMNLNQFYTALRFITMIQGGEFPISKERLLATVKVDLGFPKFKDIPVPAAPAPVPAGPAPANAASAGGAYAITPPDHIKYHGLFVTYDTDKDGLIQKDAAIEVFRKSNLPEPVLLSIFALADDNHDGALAPKEFCVAFHLILCISKKGLPLPSTLPVPLKSFLVNAPVVPPVAGAAAPGPSAHPPHATAARTDAALPSPVKKSGISSAFDFESPAQSIPLSGVPGGMASGASTPAVGHGEGRRSFTGDNDADVEVLNGVDAVKGAAKKALAAQEQSLEHNAATTSSLQGIKQRLAMDRVSLEAAVSTANLNLKESAGRLDGVVGEIGELQGQMKMLREQLEVAQKNTVGVQEQLSRAQTEKRNLSDAVEQIKSQIAGNNAAIVTHATELGVANNELSHQRSALNEQQAQRQAQNEELKTLHSEVAALTAILTAVKEDKTRSEHQLTTLQAKLRSANSSLQQEKDAHSSHQTALNQSAALVESLKNEKKALLAQIATATAATAAAQLAVEQANERADEAQRQAEAAHEQAVAAAHSAAVAAEAKQQADPEEFGYDNIYTADTTGYEQDLDTTTANLSTTPLPDKTAQDDRNVSETATEAPLAVEVNQTNAEADHGNTFGTNLGAVSTVTGGGSAISAVTSASGFDDFGSTDAVAPSTAFDASFDDFGRSGLSSATTAFDTTFPASPAAASKGDNSTGGVAFGGFDDFDSAVPVATSPFDDAFGSAPEPVSPSSGFEDFSAPTPDAVSHAASSSVFDEFGTDAASTATVVGFDAASTGFESTGFEGNGFESTGFEGGFDDFGSSAPPAEATSPFDDFAPADANAGFGDGFGEDDAFGSAPVTPTAPAPSDATPAATAEAKTNSGEVAGFDDFGSSHVTHPVASSGFEEFSPVNNASGDFGDEFGSAAAAGDAKEGVSGFDDFAPADNNNSGGFEDNGFGSEGFESDAFGANNDGPAAPTPSGAQEHPAVSESERPASAAATAASSNGGDGFDDFAPSADSSVAFDDGFSATPAASFKDTAFEASTFESTSFGATEFDASAFGTSGAAGFDSFGSEHVTRDAAFDGFTVPSGGGFDSFGDVPTGDGFDSFGAAPSSADFGDFGAPPAFDDGFAASAPEAAPTKPSKPPKSSPPQKNTSPW